MENLNYYIKNPSIIIINKNKRKKTSNPRSYQPNK